RAVVFPTGVADDDLGAGQQLLEEVGTYLERTGAAQGLGGEGAAGGDNGRVFAEQQGLCTLVVGGDAFDGQVAAGSLGLKALGLGTANRLQQGNTAFV